MFPPPPSMQMVPTGQPGAPPGSFQSTSVTSQLFQHAQAAHQQQQEQQALAAFGQFVAAGGVGGSAFGGVAAPQNGFGASLPARSVQSAPPKDYKCFECGQPGHMVRYCQQRKERLEREERERKARENAEVERQVAARLSSQSQPPMKLSLGR